MAYVRPQPAARNVFTVKRVLAILLITVLHCGRLAADAINLGSKCQHDMDCTDFIKGSACSANGYCECAPYFVQYNASTCLTSQLLGGDCILNDQCTMKVANSSCADGACRCVEGFLQFRKHTCLGPAHPGAVCYSHAHCQMFDARTHCDFLIPNLFGRCQCTAPAKLNAGLCVEPSVTVDSEPTAIKVDSSDTASVAPVAPQAPLEPITTAPLSVVQLLTSTSTLPPVTSTTTSTRTTTSTTEAPLSVEEASSEFLDEHVEQEVALPEKAAPLEPLYVTEEPQLPEKVGTPESEQVLEESLANKVDEPLESGTASIAAPSNEPTKQPEVEADSVAPADAVVTSAPETSPLPISNDELQEVPEIEVEMPQEVMATEDYPYKIEDEYNEEFQENDQPEELEEGLTPLEATTLPVASAENTLLEDTSYGHAENPQQEQYEEMHKEVEEEKLEVPQEQQKVEVDKQEEKETAPNENKEDEEQTNKVELDEEKQQQQQSSFDKDASSANAIETNQNNHDDEAPLDHIEDNNRQTLDHTEHEEQVINDVHSEEIDHVANELPQTTLLPIALDETNKIGESIEEALSLEQAVDNGQADSLSNSNNNSDNNNGNDNDNENNTVDSNLDESKNVEEVDNKSKFEGESETNLLLETEKDMAEINTSTDVIPEAASIQDHYSETPAEEEEEESNTETANKELVEQSDADSKTPNSSDNESQEESDMVTDLLPSNTDVPPILENLDESKEEPITIPVEEETLPVPISNENNKNVIDEVDVPNVTDTALNTETIEPLQQFDELPEAESPALEQQTSQDEVLHETEAEIEEQTTKRADVETETENEHLNENMEKVEEADATTDSVEEFAEPPSEIKEQNVAIEASEENKVDAAAVENIDADAVTETHIIGQSVDKEPEEKEHFGELQEQNVAQEAGQVTEQNVNNEVQVSPEQQKEDENIIEDVEPARIADETISPAVASEETEHSLQKEQVELQNSEHESPSQENNSSLEDIEESASITETPEADVEATTPVELDYNNIESFELAEPNIESVPVTQKDELISHDNEHAETKPDEMSLSTSAEATDNTHPSEEFKESESVADILNDLMSQEVTTIRPAGVEIAEPIVGDDNDLYATIVDDEDEEVPDLVAEDTNISEEKLASQEDENPIGDTTEAQSQDKDKLITFYPEMPNESLIPNAEKIVPDAESTTLIATNAETTDNAVAEPDQADLPNSTLSPEELPFDMSLEDVHPQELESDNLVLETTTIVPELLVHSETQQPSQEPAEVATANPSDILEITTQTMLGLASRVTLMEPAAPVVTTLKPLMTESSAEDDQATPEPPKVVEGDALLTSKPATEIRKRVELGLEAVSLGLSCVTDRQCQLADSNTVCNAKGVCDCASGNDSTERQCSAERTGCSPGTFQCRSSGVCISWFFVCDGRPDCTDASDEECTFNARLNQSCPPQAFKCERSGRCISRAALCDGRKQCPHGEDEIGCSAGTKPDGSKDIACPPHTFRCKSGECLPEYEYCNAIISCRDGSDEPPHLCGSRSMPNFLLRLLNAGGLLKSNDPAAYCPHKCKNGRCRSTAIVCSGRDGCGDGTDEQTCAVCRCPAKTRSTAYSARHRPMPLW